MQYSQFTVEDDQYGFEVKVDEGDYIIDLIASTNEAEPVAARATIAEALATIAALTEAIAVALQNQESE